MAINFPNSPTNGQTVVLANKTLVWSSATGTWNVQSSASSGGGSLSISDTVPSSPSDGDMWFNSTSLNLYAYYDDGDSQQWIELSSNDAQMGATVSDTAPSSPANGDFWFDSSTLTWYTYYDDGDSQQWLDLAGQATTVQVTASDTAPTSPSTGQLWFDTATAGELLMWDGYSWIQLTGVVGSPSESGGGGSGDLSGYVTTTALNTAIQDMVEFSDLSVVTGAASGGGALAYNSTTGTFTFNPAIGPDLTGYATETYVDDAIASITGATEIPDDINDLTDVDGIIPTSLTDLGITDGTNGQVLSTNGSGTFSFIDTSSVAFGAWSSTETVSATGSNNGTSNSSATIPSGTKGILIKGSTSSQNNSQGQGRLFVNGTQRAAGSVQNDGDGSVIDFNYLIYIDATTGSGTYFLNNNNVTLPGTSWVGSGTVTSIQVQAQSTSSDKNTTHSTNIYYS